MMTFFIYQAFPAQCGNYNIYVHEIIFDVYCFCSIKNDRLTRF